LFLPEVWGVLDDKKWLGKAMIFGDFGGRF
jgi:hypothetical protein